MCSFKTNNFSQIFLQFFNAFLAANILPQIIYFSLSACSFRFPKDYFASCFNPFPSFASLMHQLLTNAPDSSAHPSSILFISKYCIAILKHLTWQLFSPLPMQSRSFKIRKSIRLFSPNSSINPLHSSVPMKLRI